MKITVEQTLDGVIIAVMTFFAIPKLLAKPQSTAGFIQFEKVLHLDADFFRIFTGISELILAVLVLIFMFYKNKAIGKLAYTFLLITMITALGLEFFVRPEPKMVLVILAISLVFLAIYKLKTITNLPKIKL